MRAPLLRYARALPAALFAGFVTAVVTLVLAIALSYFLGAETRRGQITDRCLAVEVRNLIVEVIENSALVERIDMREHPPINVAGLDCSHIYRPLPTEGE